MQTKRGVARKLSPAQLKRIKPIMERGAAEGALFKKAVERTGIMPETIPEALRGIRAPKPVIRQELELIARERAKKQADRKGLSAEQQKALESEILRILDMDYRNYGRKGYRHP